MTKRIFDFVASFILLIILSPVFLIVTVAIWVTMGWPVLFRQERLGYRERVFCLLKFRTMSNARGTNGELLPDSQRITRLGAFLRRTSLDELPQLWNVLKGDMSLVGPRPLYKRYLPYYTDRERLRHTVRPGITGLAQIRGRNNLSWDERLELDVRYVERQSLLLDLKILGETVLRALERKDVVVVPGEVLKPLDEYRGKRMNERSASSPTTK